MSEKIKKPYVNVGSVGHIDHGKAALSDIVKTLEDLKRKEPEIWVLISPSGTVYKGTIQDITPVVLNNHPFMRLNQPFTI